MAGLYIHIPFCESRCIYCGFYSTTSLKKRDAYVEALCREMELRPAPQALGGDYPIETIYLGGGTPSQLTAQQLARIFDSIRSTYLTPGQSHHHDKLPHTASTPDDLSPLEVTMECNPDDVTEDFCETLSTLPVNRVSMGAQTFSDSRLRFLHRRHTAREVKTAVERLRNAGIANISIDLMFGFPYETLHDWQSDIDEAILLGADHISAYSLMYEEGTPLFRMMEQGKAAAIDEETSRQMYELLISRLTAAGYEHYEISNFARPGFRSRHNSSYWHEEPYIGIGAAAHSYRRCTEDRSSLGDRSCTEGELQVTRSWNVASIDDYIASIQQGTLPTESETLDLNTRYNDLITTALRTSDGINIKKMNEEFGDELTEKMLREAEIHIKRGLMKIKDGNLSLTHQGLYISDDVMSDFMIV